MARPAARSWAARRAQPVRPLGDGPPTDRPRRGGGPLHQGDRPCPPCRSASAQEQFTATLSAVEDAVRFAFRRRSVLRSTRRRWPRPGPPPGAAWHGLVERGKDPVEVGVHGIADQRDPLGPGPAARSATRTAAGAPWTSSTPRPRRRAGSRSSASTPATGSIAGDSTAGSWREWLAEDNKVTPADEAAFRLDFEGWLAGLPERKRRVAELLAEGHEGVVVARTGRDRAVAGHPAPVRAGGQLAGVPGAGRGGHASGGRGDRLTGLETGDEYDEGRPGPGYGRGRDDPPP